MSPVPGSDSTRPTGPHVRLTYDDFVHFPDDGMRHELIDGEHYVTPAPSWKHQTVIGNIHSHIWNYLKQHPVGRVCMAPFDVVFSSFDVVEPDVLFVSSARLPEVVTAKNLQGAPDLVVEVASPGTRRRDEQIKRELYQRAGVSEYWLVDPEADAVTIYRMVEGRYGPPEELTADRNESLTTPLLPGLELPLAAVFEDTD